MSNTNGTVEDILRDIDLDIQRLRSELQRAEEARHYILSLAKGPGTQRGHVSLAKNPASIAKDVAPSQTSTGTSQRQQVIDLAIAILKDRDNKPIRRDELYEEMQARGLQLRKSNPTHYVASKVLGSAKTIFGNMNGYYLLEHPIQPDK
ncbi:hypothetical protein J2W42_002749 [Rhizobium tibeticum]|uniref:hypothetical protein n=1 Tax=Rhizobium tibeticum TaxID=501024 RepID=UPI00277D97D4|nr:hypothetical protein [Rhizobium tibeticum]MDP9809890.1 hypothetical protein [Rhizobium tibeticum]